MPINYTVYIAIAYLLLSQLCYFTVYSQQANNINHNDNYTIDYRIYHNYTSYTNTIHHYARQQQYNNLIDVYEYDSYKTHYNNNSIYHIILSDKTTILSQNGVDNKPHVLITCGEHAREFITTESCLDFISYILNSYTTLSCNTYDKQLSQFILQNYILHIFPLINPSGRLHIERSNDYCYRNNYPDNIDVNRNFDWSYGNQGSSNDVNSEEYRGKQPFDTVESQIIKYVLYRYRYNITAYVTVHSGERQLFVPFVDTISKNIKRRRNTTDIELSIANYIFKRSNNWYRNYGIAYEYNDYGADGTAMACVD